MSKSFSHLIDLEKSLLSPSIRHSSEQLCTILAPDFIEIGSSGTVYDRDSIIKILDSEETITVYSRHFETKELSPDVILITYETSRDATFYSGAKRSSVWQKNNDLWQMVHHQGTNYGG